MYTPPQRFSHTPNKPTPSSNSTYVIIHPHHPQVGKPHVLGVAQRSGSGSTKRLRDKLDTDFVVLDFAGSIAGNTKDQDRFVMVRVEGRRGA